MTTLEVDRDRLEADVTHPAPGLSPARRTLRSLVWLLVFSVVARGAGFFKEMAVAHELGVSQLTDHYVLAFNWVQWLPAVFGSLAISTFIPMLSEMRRESQQQGDRLADEFAGLTVLLGAILAVLTAAAPLVAIPFFGAEASLSTSLPAMAWVAPALVFAGYGTAMLVASHRHSNLMLEGIPALAFLAFLLAVSQPTLQALSLATSVGYWLYAAAILAMLHFSGHRFRPRLSFRSPGWRRIGRGALALLVSTLCVGAVLVVDQTQAAALGEGAASTLSFANRLLMIPVMVCSMLIPRAMLPVLSELDPVRDRAVFISLVRRFALAGAALGLVTAAVVWPIAPWMVSLMFERGSFSAQDSAATADALRWGILQLPAFAASLVLVQALLSNRWFVAVAVSGVFNLVGKLIFNSWLGPIMGVNGITLATSVVMTLSLGLLLIAYLRLNRSSAPLPAQS